VITGLQSSLSVPLDLGGRRDKRIAVVSADVQREQLQAATVERQTVATAVAAYYQNLCADRLVALAEERVRLAESAETTARQRQRAGDVAVFEVNLARGEVARAQSAVAAAKSEQLRARAGLANALGLAGTSLSVSGDLADRSMFDKREEEVASRPDLRVLAQDVEVARAEVALAGAQRWPSLDLRVTYEHDVDADTLLGGIAIAIPIFERGQGDAAVARARAKRAGIELDTKLQQVSTQLATARATYASAIAAVEILERQAMPLSSENETAAAASYRAGKIDINTLLLVRREAIDTQREHLDRLLEAALAGVELWLARGANP
jgi:cobalt-zinc-cadmium efflux system outer membrane protein